jgi:hypothetical protein
MENVLDYVDDFKKDVVLYLKDSFNKYQFKLSVELSKNNINVFIYNNNSFVELSYINYFPKIFVTFDIFENYGNIINWDKKLSKPMLTENDFKFLSANIVFEDSDSDVIRQLKEIDKLWINYYEGIFMPNEQLDL